VQRILASLRGDGTEPILILRVLAREVRSMAQIAARLRRGERESQVLQSFAVWPRRRALVTQALRRSGADTWRQLLRQAARADKIVKGRLPGDIWQELQCLTLAMCGRHTSVCVLMERAQDTMSDALQA
jgi:DNA polymerase III subunit delta